MNHKKIGKRRRAASGDIDTRVAKILAQLPQEELLALAETTTQVQKWVNLRGFNTEVSACWESKLRLQDNPIAWMKRGNKDARANHRLIWAYVYMHNAWWDLLQQCFDEIRQNFYQVFEGLDLTFPSSAHDLFWETVAVEENAQFLAYLEPDQRFSVPDTIKAHKLIRWSPSTQPSLHSDLARLAPHWLGHNIWHGFAYHVCQQEAKSEDTAHNLLTTLRKKVSELEDLKVHIMEASYKGRLDTKIRSYVMHNGEEALANCYGGAYRS